MPDFKFIRDVRLQVGDIVIDSRSLDPGQSDESPVPTNALRFTFKTDLSVNRHPNTNDIKIYNLSPNFRSRLTQGQNDDNEVNLTAGYVRSRKKIYQGRTFQITHRRENVDWVTDIRCQEGRANFTSKRVSISIPPGTTVVEVLKQLAAQLENIDIKQAIDKLNLKGSLKAQFQDFKKGIAISGKLSDKLFDWLTSAGYEASIQQEKLEITEPGETLGNSGTDNAVVEISEQRGMIGSPQVGLGGLITVRTLLDGELLPNRRVRIFSQNILEGSEFKIFQAGHIGDNRGQDWYTDLVVRAFGIPTQAIAGEIAFA